MGWISKHTEDAWAVILGIVVILMFAGGMGIAIWNEHKFDEWCAAHGGVTVRYGVACVKPDAIIATSN